MTIKLLVILICKVVHFFATLFNYKGRLPVNIYEGCSEYFKLIMILCIRRDKTIINF